MNKTPTSMLYSFLVGWRESLACTCSNYNMMIEGVAYYSHAQFQSKAYSQQPFFDTNSVQTAYATMVEKSAHKPQTRLAII